MQEAPIPLLSPEVTFKHERIPPPPGAYITKDDFLAVSVFTTATTTGLRLAYRFLDSGGHPHYGSESLDGVSASTLTTKIFPLTEGFLLGASVSNLGGGLADQVCFVGIALQRSGQASTAPHTVLSQGYVTNLFTVTWPPTMPRGPATGSGLTNWPALNNSPDRPPATANAMDDEFDAVTLDPKWTLQNQLAGNTSVNLSCLVLTTATPDTALHAITQPLPAGTSWAIEAKIDGNVYWDGPLLGLVLLETATSKIVTFSAHHSQYPARIYLDAWTSFTLYSANIAYSSDGHTHYMPIYLKVTRAGANLTYSWARNPSSWIDRFTRTVTQDFTTAPNAIGLHLGPQSTTTGYNSSLNVDWFRRIA